MIVSVRIIRYRVQETRRDGSVLNDTQNCNQMTVFSELLFDLYDRPLLSVSDLFPYIGEKNQ